MGIGIDIGIDIYIDWFYGDGHKICHTF